MFFEPKKGNVIYNIKERWIKIFGTINQATAGEFAKFLILSHACNPDWRSPILVLIDSRGGDAVASWLIYHMIANSFSPVVTVAEKKVYSGALTIFQAGSRRLILKRAELMFHWAEFRFLKNEDCDIERVEQLKHKLDRVNDYLYRVYRRRSGLAASMIRKFFREGKVLTAKEAVRHNLADEIVEDLGRISGGKTRKWKLKSKMVREKGG